MASSFTRVPEAESSEPLGCYGRFRAEWSLTLFDLNEADGKTIDIVASFQPQTNKAVVIIAKIIFLGWTISAMIHDLVKNRYAGAFWFAWLTVWATILSTAYLYCSLYSLVVCPPSQDNPSPMIYICWTLSSVAAVCELLVTLLYWTLEFGPSGDPFTYGNFMVHGGVGTLVWIDALIINRTPVRFRQMAFMSVLALLYSGWTGIHATSNIGNPYDSADHDAIYSSIDWNEKPIDAAIIIVLVNIVGVPILFSFFWALSAYGGGCRFDNGNRRHLSPLVEADRDDDEKLERGKAEEEEFDRTDVDERRAGRAKVEDGRINGQIEEDEANEETPVVAMPTSEAGATQQTMKDERETT